MHACSWGTDALMFGSFMMFASGVSTIPPRSARSSVTRCSSGRMSANAARTRPAREMSRVSTGTPAAPAKARITGRKAWVARAGASSVQV